jgi:hypothetical protein
MRNLILFAAVLCLLAGCDSGGGGSTVTGKVTLDDGTAAPRGGVTLRNDGGSFRGSIESDGTYTVENVPDGDYEVAVAGVTDREVDSEAGMAYDDDTGEYADTEADAPKSLIKAKYSNLQQSGLTITVPGGSYDLTVERDGAAPAPAEAEAEDGS